MHAGRPYQRVTLHFGPSSVQDRARRARDQWFLLAGRAGIAWHTPV